MDRYLEEYPPVLNVSQVADILGVTNQTVRKLIVRHQLKGIRVGSCIRVPKDRLIDYLNNST